LKKSSSWAFGYDSKGVSKIDNIRKSFADASPEQLLNLLTKDAKAINKEGNEDQYPGLSNLFKALSEQRAILFKSKEAHSLSKFREEIDKLKKEAPLSSQFNL